MWPTMNHEQRAARRRLGETELALHRAADASRRAEIARCRAAFKEAYRSGKIYAIEYIYRVNGWSYPDKKGKTRREYWVQRGRTMPYMESIGFVPYSVTPCGVMVAVRDGDYLAFGASALDLVDRWNKYIGLALALQRALGEGTPWAAKPVRGLLAHPCRFSFDDFCAEQRERLRGDIAKRDHGDRRGIVTTTARGDARVEVPAFPDLTPAWALPYHHNPQSTGTWLGLKTDPPAQPSPIIAVEPEPAIIKPGQRLNDDALKITATGSVYREVKK